MTQATFHNRVVRTIVLVIFEPELMIRGQQLKHRLPLQKQSNIQSTHQNVATSKADLEAKQDLVAKQIKFLHSITLINPQQHVQH